LPKINVTSSIVQMNSHNDYVREKEKKMYEKLNKYKRNQNNQTTICNHNNSNDLIVEVDYDRENGNKSSITIFHDRDDKLPIVSS
jgi:hypothetical protein